MALVARIDEREAFRPRGREPGKNFVRLWERAVEPLLDEPVKTFNFSSDGHGAHECALTPPLCREQRRFAGASRNQRLVRAHLPAH